MYSVSVIASPEKRCNSVPTPLHLAAFSHRSFLVLSLSSSFSYRSLAFIASLLIPIAL